MQTEQLPAQMTKKVTPILPRRIITLQNNAIYIIYNFYDIP